MTQILTDSVRIFLGHFGETITKSMVLALHSECEEGETAHIYPLGRVTPQAVEVASRLKVQIHSMSSLKNHLREGGKENDDWLFD